MGMPRLLCRGDLRGSMCGVSPEVSLHVRFWICIRGGEGRFGPDCPVRYPIGPEEPLPLRLVPERLLGSWLLGSCFPVCWQPHSPTHLLPWDVRMGRSKGLDPAAGFVQSGGCTMDAEVTAWVFWVLFNFFFIVVKCTEHKIFHLTVFTCTVASFMSLGNLHPHSSPEPFNTPRWNSPHPH